MGLSEQSIPKRESINVLKQKICNSVEQFLEPHHTGVVTRVNIHCAVASGISQSSATLVKRYLIRLRVSPTIISQSLEFWTQNEPPPPNMQPYDPEDTHDGKTASLGLNFIELRIAGVCWVGRGISIKHISSLRMEHCVRFTRKLLNFQVWIISSYTPVSPPPTAAS